MERTFLAKLALVKGDEDFLVWQSNDPDLGRRADPNTPVHSKTWQFPG